MIEELKQLVTLINGLPQLALWIAIGLFAYKIAIVGSVYGVIRYVAGQLFLTLRERKNPPPLPLRGEIDGKVILSEVDELLQQIKRLRGIKSGSAAYIHGSDIAWLAKQIDAELRRKQEEERVIA